MLTPLKSFCRVTIPSGTKSSPSLSSFSPHDTLLLPFSGLPSFLSLRPCLSFTDSPQGAFTPVLICPTKIPFPLLATKTRTATITWDVVAYSAEQMIGGYMVMKEEDNRKDGKGEMGKQMVRQSVGTKQ